MFDFFTSTKKPNSLLSSKSNVLELSSNPLPDFSLSSLDQKKKRTKDLYTISDADAVRTRILENIKEKIASSFPLEDDNFKLIVENLEYETSAIDPDKEKDAIINDRTLKIPLRGDVILYDKKNNKIVSKERKRIAAVPVLTWRGTFILNGSEYGFINQLRLRPGVYVSPLATGEMAARVNISGGLAHNIVLDPESGVFNLRIQQASLPFFPILKEVFGFSDKELQDVLGKQLYLANAETLSKSEQTIDALYKIINPKGNAVTIDEKKEAIRNAFFNARLDPNVTKITLGVETDRLNKDVVLAALAKTLRANRGDLEAIDDRNHLAFAKVYGPEDIFAEAIEKAKNNIRRYFNSVRARRDVKYFPSGAFDSVIEEAIYKSGLGQNLQEINPVEMFDTRYRVTRTGAGGIENKDAIPLELRYLHPSHLGILDPVLTPEGENVGVDNRFSVDTKRDTEGNIYVRLKDVKTGKTDFIKTTDLVDKVIAFPGEMEQEKPFVNAVINNQHVVVPRREVDLVLPSAKSLYSPLSNLVPLKQNSYGQRVSMGARMIAQAVPLAEPEVPLVQSVDPETGQSFQKIYGEKMGALTAPVEGTVIRVANDAIFIQDAKGNKYRVGLYKDFPLNRKTFYNEVPLVKAGDKVRKGQIIARSNYTDNEGNLALGKNLKTAYMAWEGLNFEDAAVISESGAKKLLSEHMYQEWDTITANKFLDKRKFISLFPGKYSRETLEKYDENGLPKPGVKIEKGEPLALVVEKVIAPGREGPTRIFQDASPVWEYEDPAEVVYSVLGKKNYNVITKVRHTLKVGDKIAGRWGDKHIISAIIPDEQMPKDENGEPFDLILNPLGVQGRVNTSQLWELVLSKLAKKTGKPILVEDHTADMYERFGPELEKAGIKEKELVKTKYGDFLVPTGYRYIHKLHHYAESKLGERSFGAYSSEETPAKGGDAGAKRVGLLEMLGILGHGAYHTAREIRAIRGQKNDMYWLRLQLGYDVPQKAEVPMVYDKFMEQLRVIGLNPKDTGSEVEILPLTNSDVKKLAGNRYLKGAEGVKVAGDDIVPIEGGLFDPKLTGGLTGTHWSAIPLPEPIPNPAAEDVIRNLLGLTKENYRKYLAGEIDPFGFGPGPEGMKKALANLDLEKLLESEEKRLPSLRGNNLNDTVKRIKILRNLINNKISPDELMWDAVPVLPPIYRPVSYSSFSGIPLISDLNYLYKNIADLAQINEALKREGLLESSDRLKLYDALKALAGLGDPVHPKLKAQNVKGALKLVIGDSPKEGVVQKKLLGATIDLIARATIIPNPNLSVDEIGIPEDAAWQIYKPYVIRRLVREGMPKVRAIEEVSDKTETARNALIKEMEERPVIMTRAPVLWKHGVLAAYPKLTKNKVIEIHPLIVPFLGADFDGDAMNVYPLGEPESIQEAREKLLPSKQLFSPTRFRTLLYPTMEYLAGLYYLSQLRGEGEPKRFKSVKQLVRALLSGEIDPRQRVIVEQDE